MYFFLSFSYASILLHSFFIVLLLLIPKQFFLLIFIWFLLCLFKITAPIDANADPVLHTCQTVGRLSNKVARRVYRTVSRQVKMLKKEDVQEYVASLIAVLRLTQYLNFINERVQAGQSTIAIDSENERNEQLNKQQPPQQQQQQQQPQHNGYAHPPNNE